MICRMITAQNETKEYLQEDEFSSLVVESMVHRSGDTVTIRREIDSTK